ncbi:MAG: hypothetical protein JRH18_12940 [Deltaproteobacteria bacterium]|nr:hypothetical protein [Deltaproteobacteria bacterium]MBW2152562.1 hypothetical protein [Deltaproteobacteria bacterium]
MPKNKSTVGQMLVKALTLEQIASLLTVVSDSTGLNRFMDECIKIDPDMAVTVKKILAADQGSASKGKTKPLASLKRTMESWASLWCKFDDAISELGDEDGKYAVQDHHWESPYFDGSSLAYDLEPIAQDMLKLIEEVYSEVDDADVFSKALEEIDTRIDMYPEWMGVEHGEPCILQENMTQCVLTWLWLSSQHERHPGRSFAEKTISLENALEMVALDENAMAGFFTKLPDDACRQIYEFLQEGDHGANLDNTYSAWHQIHHSFEKRFEPGNYLETCRKHLAKNWRYGKPLIDDALSHKNYQEAESLHVKTFASYLSDYRKKAWYPETTLLILETRTLFDEGDKEITLLLNSWSDVAMQLEHPGRGAAAKFQAVVFDTPEKWNAVLTAYRRLSQLDTQGVLPPLFVQWKNEMAARSYPYFLEPHKVTDTWIHWLIDAQLDVKNKKGWFLNKLAQWLSNLKDDTKTFKKQWLWLVPLTTDLSQSKKITKKYPNFWETVLGESDSKDDLTVSRRDSLKEMNADPFLKTILEVWQKQLRHIVPDPADAHKSDYERHARWAQALFELNKDEYKVLITRWHKKHDRRRNLWRDLKAKHLPLG